WIDRKVYIYELPFGPHKTCSVAIKREIYLKDLERMMIALGSIRTRAGGTGREPDGSLITRGKPNVNSNGHEGPVSHKPWPNLVIEVAFSEFENHLLNAVKYYLLHLGRAHDAIAVKLVRSDTIISRMK
ncbi:5833_t:CDS:2, partial [Gigaspora rosea]